MDTKLGKEFYPEPFPEGLPTVDLERISLAKLLGDDQEEAERLFKICTHEGFCYINLMDHPKGIKLLEDAHLVHQMGQDICHNTSMSEKYAFKLRAAEVGLLDTGYKEFGVDEEGNPNRAELFNFSQAGFFSGTEDYHLPPWLANYEILLRSIIRDGNVVHNIILAILEKQLLLPLGTFTSLHKLTDRSGDFIRLLHYPVPKHGRIPEASPFPAHKDSVSVSLLFCWQGGLQITNSTNSMAVVDHTVDEPEDTWFYVPPVPGHVIMNLGNVMQIFSNGVLKSGKHRVVLPPGAQAKYDRYSVLITARPKEDTPMRSFKSPMIPEGEQIDGEVLTAKQWGMQQVVKLVHKIKKENGEHVDQ